MLRPEMFSGIGALPEPATESHVVNRGTPVALSAKGPGKKSHPRGKPLQSSFPKYHELFEEPHHCKAADNSLTAKAASIRDSSQSETCPPLTVIGLFLSGDHPTS
jgi:hypothetical protein